MRLDIDCLRDVLLCIEEHTGLRNYCYFIDKELESIANNMGSVSPIQAYQEKLLEKYDNDTLLYHVHFCVEAEFAKTSLEQSRYKMWIADLTPKGHEFLANIRDTKQWTTVKKGLAAVRNYSLSAISSVAQGVTSAAINAYLSQGG